MMDLSDRDQCKYGITVLAEEQGELDSECETPATRNVMCMDKRMPSGIAVIELCELHYQGFLAWEKRQK